ncbi:MAG: hypothetical protein PHO77_09310 [Bacteroidales bacterium]|nr:hypothetical protein [Bacteroidales bacterium]MDD3939896.1 hypothetical protein [Patescibacteria group bacterium]
MKKIIFLVFCLLSIASIFVACEKSIPFIKDKWTKCGGFDGDYWINCDVFVTGNERYKMSLWLEENYNFCNKSLSEILEKFYIKPKPENYSYGDSLCFDDVLKNKVLRILIKQYDPNPVFTLLTEPYIDTDWFEIYFDENYFVSKAYFVHYNHKTNEKTKRIICEILEKESKTANNN